MGTKLKPGQFDPTPEPDEPFFLLLARDPAAPGLVRRWAAHRGAEGASWGASQAQIDEALACADAMEAWREAHRQ
jgi:hypothetical protein